MLSNKTVNRNVILLWITKQYLPALGSNTLSTENFYASLLQYTNYCECMEHLNITIVGVWDIFFSSQTNANSRSQVAWQFFFASTTRFIIIICQFIRSELLDPDRAGLKDCSLIIEFTFYLITCNSLKVIK